MPQPLVVQVMQAHKAALIRQDTEQMTAMAAQWRRVEEALQDQVELFARRVAEDRLNPGQLQSRQFQLDRYQSLLSQTRVELDKYTNYAESLITERQRTLGSTAINQAGQAIRAATDGVRISFNVLPIRAIENMVGLGGNGSPLRDLLVDSYGAAADGMLNALVRATSTGQNPRVTARAMVRDGLSQSLNRMMVTARTEQMRVFRESSRMAYQASGVVESYKRLATKDPRTCLGCLVLDGEEYSLDESLREHPAGRCTLLPVVKGFKPVTWETGQEWLQRQDEKTQRSILGPGRYDLWSSGQIDLNQMATVRRNDTWGDSAVPTSVGELRSLARPVTVREPEPTPEPIVRQPLGAPVSDALKLPKSGKYRARYQTTLDAINQVHGDGQLPEIPVKSRDNINAFGYYKHANNGRSVEIVIKGTSDHPELTLAHEIGHFLDHQTIGDNKRFASLNSDVMKEWRNAVQQSRAVKDLQDKYNNPDKYQGEVEYNGRRFNTKPDRKYLKYTLDDIEIWARSYAQYIAVRSGNQTMIDQVAERRKVALYGSLQWDDDDFAPIAKEIDKVFGGLGWQR